jgi:hypothetical protein
VAEPVVTARILFIAIEAQTVASAFGHLVGCEAPLVALYAALLGGQRRGGPTGSGSRGAGGGSVLRAYVSGGSYATLELSSSSTWRARLIAAPSISGLWIWMV